MVICKDCKHCIKDPLFNLEFSKCANSGTLISSKINPVTGKIQPASTHYWFCTTMNPGGRCSDFEQKDVPTSFWKRLLAALV